MKTRLIIFLLFLGFTELSAQNIYVPGTVVRGKNVAYRCMEETIYFLRLRNVNNVDTTRISYYNDGRVVEEDDLGVNSDDIGDPYEVFREVLTNEEWNKLKGKNGGLIIDIVADNKGNTVELSFFFIKTDPVMTKMDPDRLFLLEQKLKGIIKVDGNDPNVRNIRNLKYSIVIRYMDLK